LVFIIDNQLTLKRSFFKEGICVINLLALLDKNKDIVDIAESSLYINFDQIMIEIYSDTSVIGIIPIAFE
jgi:hypothetical protein